MPATRTSFSLTLPRQAPHKPNSPPGQMAAYYLQMQPHLFAEAVDSAFLRIKEAREAEAAAEVAKRGAEGEGSAEGSSELVLYQRMAQVRAAEQRQAIEDLMYVCILERFQVGAGPSLLGAGHLDPVVPG